MAESEALRLAKQAEKDLNSYQAKQGLGAKSDSSMLLSTFCLLGDDADPNKPPSPV